MDCYCAQCGSSVGEGSELAAKGADLIVGPYFVSVSPVPK